MSNSYNYNPVPQRAWSRVQNLCTYIVPDSSYNSAYIPLTGQTVSQGQADYEMKLFYKGNILQYKGNSLRLTKTLQYSQLAKGFGPNRTKVFATQTQTYTNPNTTGLQRVNFTTYQYPNQIVGAPNNISGPFQYNVQSPFDCSSNSVQDGGNLVCGTYTNQCTGQIIKRGALYKRSLNPYSRTVNELLFGEGWKYRYFKLFSSSEYFDHQPKPARASLHLVNSTMKFIYTMTT
jgi:hypothetical protein